MRNRTLRPNRRFLRSLQQKNGLSLNQKSTWIQHYFLITFIKKIKTEAKV